jgi:hypothetical protein
LARACRRGDVPELPRLGNQRIVYARDLGALRRRLTERGYLPAEE